MYNFTAVVTNLHKLGRSRNAMMSIVTFQTLNEVFEEVLEDPVVADQAHDMASFLNLP